MYKVLPSGAITSAVGPYFSGRVDLTVRLAASNTSSAPVLPDESGEENCMASNAVAPCASKTMFTGLEASGTEGVRIFVSKVCEARSTTETSNPALATQTSLAGPVMAGRMPKGPLVLGTTTSLTVFRLVMSTARRLFPRPSRKTMAGFGGAAGATVVISPGWVADLDRLTENGAYLSSPSGYWP